VLTVYCNLAILTTSTTQFRNYVIKVEQDDMNESPREWDNLGTMVCFHSRHNLGDSHDYNSPQHFMHALSGLYEYEDTDYLTDEQLTRCQEEVEKKNVILPLYLYEHGGITMRTSAFSCQWDSGQVGYIYIPLTRVREEYNVKRVTTKTRERIEGYLKGEVETYDHFLTGSVYWYSVERHDDDGDEVHIDSCGGYFGYYTDDEGYMVDCIKGAIQYDIEHTPLQAQLF